MATSRKPPKPTTNPHSGQSYQDGDHFVYFLLEVWRTNETITSQGLGGRGTKRNTMRHLRTGQLSELTADKINNVPFWCLAAKLGVAFNIVSCYGDGKTLERFNFGGKLARRTGKLSCKWNAEWQSFYEFYYVEGSETIKCRVMQFVRC